MDTRELHPLYPYRHLKEATAYNMIMMQILCRIDLLITPISSPGSIMSARLVLPLGKVPSHPIRRAVIEPDSPSMGHGLHRLVSTRTDYLQHTRILLSDLHLNPTSNKLRHSHTRLKGTLLNNLRNLRSLKRQKTCLLLHSKPHSLHSQRTLLHLQFHPTHRKTHYSPLSPRLSRNKSIQTMLTTFLLCLRSVLNKPP